MTDQASITAKNLARTVANRALANDSAIWMQQDAVNLKGPPNPNTPNPFVQSQAASIQTPINPVAPTGSQQKKP